jgi:hypothetical protein
VARTAFVLSGGASLGAAQAGMLAALFEREIRPDLLVGTSAGALNAAFVASRPPTPATAAELAEIWRRLERPPHGAIEATAYALSLLVDVRLDADIARYSSEVELIVLSPGNSSRIIPKNFDHADQLIDEALAASRRALDLVELAREVAA